MKSEIIQELLKETNLKTKITVECELAFMNLLCELGYREDKPWTEDEDHILNKLQSLAEDLSKSIMNEIENHQKPKESDLAEKLKNYLETTPEEEIQKAWDDTKEFDLVGPTVEEYLNSFKKYNGFFDEAWNIYQISVLEKFEKDTLIANYALTNLDDFVTRIITDEKFAREWRFEVDQRDLSLEERNYSLGPEEAYLGIFGMYEKDDLEYKELFDKENRPTKSIKVTYNNKTFQFYA